MIANDKYTIYAFCNNNEVNIMKSYYYQLKQKYNLNDLLFLEINDKLDKLENNSIVLCYTIDMLAKSLKQLHKIVKVLEKKNMQLITIKESINTLDKPIYEGIIVSYNLMYNNFVKNIIKGRSINKVSRTRAQSQKYKLLKENAINRFKNNQSITSIARDLKISRFSIYDWLRSEKLF